MTAKTHASLSLFWLYVCSETCAKHSTIYYIYLVSRYIYQKNTKDSLNVIPPDTMYSL